jgi:ribosome recycling factor
MPTTETHEKARRKMHDTIEHTRRELAAIRTGRASLAILDGIQVDYYGAPTPIQQVCTLTIPDATLIVAQPWDVSMIGSIEKAILKADLGLNPANDGKVVRIPIPPLTEDRRKQLVKKVHEIAEQGRTAIRLERREANEIFKRLLKDKKISEDDERRALEVVQKLTDDHIQQVDVLSRHKESELMTI